MPRNLFLLILLTAAGVLAGCTTYNVGSKYESPDNGSYAGQTLNSPVSDQNPHPGGDASFPSGDTSTDHPPPDKIDGR